MVMAISEIKGQNIGLLGGTFDPVHNGHLAAARTVKGQLGLDAVLLIPAFAPPHKSNYQISSFDHRVVMLQAAVASEPDLFVCQVERERGDPSYTIDTLIYLNRQLAGVHLYFIIGADAFAEIHTWKEYNKLLAQANLVVLNRPGCTISTSGVMGMYFPAFDYDSLAKVWQAKDVAGRVYCLEMPPVNISSSQVRQDIIGGLGVSNNNVPRGVIDYITVHGLYASQ